MIIAGADPGAQGAIAFLNAETRRLVAIISMPMAGSDLRVRDLVMDIDQTLDGLRVGMIFIERQAPFVAGDKARIGAKTAFSIGERFMAIKAIAACLGWPGQIVSPAKWQKALGITKANKATSLALADQLMPEDCGLWKPRRGYCTKEQAIGRAEAALIAMYGVQAMAGISRSLEPPLADLARGLPDDPLDRMVDEAANG